MSRIAEPRHPLTESHFFSKFFVRLDPMHIMDLRGMISIAAGSMLQKLLQFQSLGRNKDERMAALNARMKRYQEEHNTSYRMPPLRQEDLVVSGWHSLGGKIVKAANTRAVLPWLHSLAEEFFNAHGSYASSTRKVIHCLLEIQKIWYSAGHFFSDAQKKTLDDLFLKLGRHWQNLRALARAQHQNAWQITPKVHYGQHFGEQGDLINPTSVQNYLEESLVGCVTKLWHMCAHGKYLLVVQHATLNRYWVGLEIRMTAESIIGQE